MSEEFSGTDVPYTSVTGSSAIPTKIAQIEAITSTEISKHNRTVVKDAVITAVVVLLVWVLSGLTIGFAHPDHQSSSNSTFAPDEISTIRLSAYTTSMISSTAAALVLVVCLIARKFRSHRGRLVMGLLTCDMCYSICIWLSLIFDGAMFCRIQSALLNMFQIGSVTYIAWISFILFEIAALERKPYSVERLESAMHISVWTLALTIATTLLCLDIHNRNLAWCWINQNNAEWRFLSFYSLLFVTFAYSAIVYITVVARMYSAFKRVWGTASAKMQTRRIIRKFSLFLTAFFITWLWAVINRLYSLFAEEQIYFLVLMHCLFFPLGGLLNSAAYGIGIILDFVKNVRQKKQSLIEVQNRLQLRLSTENLDCEHNM